MTDPAVRTDTTLAAPSRPAWGWGLATVHDQAGTLDTYFPQPTLGAATDDAAPGDLTAAVRADEDRGVRTEVVRVEVDLDAPPAGAPAAVKAPVPPLLRGYLRLGAQVCGPPAHDPDFGCADFFVLLDADRIDPRYLRHFLGESR